MITDTERLEYVLRSLAPVTMRDLLGGGRADVSLEEFRVLIDWRMDSKQCDRCGYRVLLRHRTTLPTKYQGCDVCTPCLEELEPGRATTPKARHEQ